MSKSINKGFILAELIAVSAVIITALIVIYVQFVNIINSYNVSFKYNTVEDLYSVNNIESYILSDSYEELVAALDDNDYIDITSCSVDYFTEYKYCEGLFNNLRVKTVLFTTENTTNIINSLNTNNPYTEGLKKFIKHINVDGDSQYRLIVEFDDKTYASLKIVEE